MKQTKNEYKLFQKIIKWSFSNDWEESKKEWNQKKIFILRKGEFGTCTCGKYPIKEIIVIENTNTNKRLPIGNCCIKKFFNIKDYDKVFNALKKNKVNRFMINDSFKKSVISRWEGNFMLDLWRKRILTYKQQELFYKIKKKIIRSYKNGYK